MDFLQQKAKAIIDCFLLSEVVPRVQVRQLPSTPYPHPQYILTLRILARQFTVIYSICQWNNQSYFLTVCISLNLMLYMYVLILYISGICLSTGEHSERPRHQYSRLPDSVRSHAGPVPRRHDSHISCSLLLLEKVILNILHLFAPSLRAQLIKYHLDLFVLGVSSHSKIVHSFGVVTITVQGSKFWPMLGIQGHWEVRVL